MKALFIDGPLRGQVRDDVDTRVYQCADYASVPPVSAVPPADAQTEVFLPVVTYYVEVYRLCGKQLRLASVRYHVQGEELDPVTFWDLFASDKAKQVVLPE